jgi:hypothetical protein
LIQRYRERGNHGVGRLYWLLGPFLVSDGAGAGAWCNDSSRLQRMRIRDELDYTRIMLMSFFSSFAVVLGIILNQRTGLRAWDMGGYAAVLSDMRYMGESFRTVSAGTGWHIQFEYRGGSSLCFRIYWFASRVWLRLRTLLTFLHVLVILSVKCCPIDNILPVFLHTSLRLLGILCLKYDSKNTATKQVDN